MSTIERLRQQTAAARALLTAYADILGDDAQAKHDAVEGETGLHEAIKAGIGRIVEVQGLVAGIDLALGTLKDRKARLEAQDERIRAAMLTAMEVSGLQKLETPLGTVSRRAVPPSVVVTDEHAIPPDYWVEQDPKLDKRALLQALKALPPGEHIAGAELSNGGSTIALKLT